jgi:hypothetical protein
MKSLLAADVEEELCRQPITDADMEKMPRCRVQFQFLVPRTISVSGAAYNFSFLCRVQFQFLVPRDNFNFWCRVQFQFLVPRDSFNFCCRVQFQFPRLCRTSLCRLKFFTV